MRRIESPSMAVPVDTKVGWNGIYITAGSVCPRLSLSIFGPVGLLDTLLSRAAVFHSRFLYAEVQLQMRLDRCFFAVLF